MDLAAATLSPPGLSDPRFSAAFARLLQIEGGFVDSPADHGGPTKYGLSLRFLAQQGALTPALVAEVDINRDGVIDLPDIAGMTVATARQVYFAYFWAPPRAATLPVPLDAAVFDQTVNDGLVPAVKLLQLALNGLRAKVLEPLAVDGLLGGGTRARLNVLLGQCGAARVLDAYRVQAVGRYREIAERDPSQRRFLAGWLNRAAELGDV